MKSRIGLFVLVVVVLAVIVVMPATAATPASDQWEQVPEYSGKVLQNTNGRPGIRLVGSVIAVDEHIIVLDVPLGQINVHTDARTRFILQDVESPSVGDIAIGMKIAVQGRRRGRIFRAQVVFVLPENGGRARGEVTVIGEGSFKLATDNEILSVMVDERTRFWLPDIANPSLDDLNVGDRVVVTGLHQDEGVFLARWITPVYPRTEARQGSVVAVDAESLTVQLPRGPEVLLTITDETIVFVPGIVDATIADVAVGDVVRVRGEVADDVILALRVFVIPPDAAALIGVVSGGGGTTIQVETRTEQIISVHADAATQIIIPGVEAPTLADLRQGDKVRIGGSWLNADDFHGWIIQVGKEGRVGRVRGRLLSLEGAGFVVGSLNGTVDVVTDDETRYRIPYIDEPTFDDLAEGQWVVVRGLFEEDGRLRGRIVVGRPQR